MSGEACKFCGGMCDETDTEPGRCFSCALSQEEHRDDADLSRFRTLFPTIMPDDPREITAEICETLGLVQKQGVIVQSWSTPEDPKHTVVAFMKGEEPSVRGLIEDGRKHTAGQLACLIAERRNAP